VSARIWSREDVDRLNAHQRDGRFHPYTCPGEHEHCHKQRNLIATPHGWVCECGEYKQGWAHGVGGRP
jgi:hypothetical protein